MRQGEFDSANNLLAEAAKLSDGVAPREIEELFAVAELQVRQGPYDSGADTLQDAIRNAATAGMHRIIRLASQGHVT